MTPDDDDDEAKKGMRPQDMSKHEESKILFSDLQQNQRKMVTKQILTNSVSFINSLLVQNEWYTAGLAEVVQDWVRNL